MGQRHAADDLGGFRRFRAVGLQELQTGGRGEEQVLDFDLGALVQRRGPGRRQEPAFDRDDMGHHCPLAGAR